MTSLSNDLPTSSDKKFSDTNIYQKADNPDAHRNDINVYNQLLIKNESDYLKPIDLNYDMQDEGNLHTTYLDCENIQTTCNNGYLVPINHCKDRVMVILNFCNDTQYYIFFILVY